MLQKDGKLYTLSPQGLIPAGKQEMAGLETLLKSPNGVYQTGFSSINLTDKLFLSELDAEIYFIASLPYITGDDIPSLFIPVILLLLLLTSILFINFAAGTRRISRLTRHFQASNSGNLEPLEQDNYHDEIGFLYECYNRMAGNINHLVNDVYKAELKSRDARYYALQSQINPHFLLNSLENIRMTAMMHGDNETSGMIYKLAKMMNYTIRQSNLVSTLAQEVDHCRNYLEFCVIRMGSGFNYTIACPDELAEQACPKFILQPIVENSIEHAFDSRAQKKKVTIAISSIDEEIQVEVADNGRGMDAESLEALRLLLKNGLEDNGTKAEYSPEEGHGIGLLNVHERLKIFFGSSCGIEIESSDRGTIVKLLLDPHPDSAFAAAKHTKTQIY
jgi:two-component system sensor histidine kinase YesM